MAPRRYLRTWALHVAANSAVILLVSSSTSGASGDIINLGTLGRPGSYGFGVNSAGHVAGYGTEANVGFYRAFIYKGNAAANGQMIELGTLGGANSYAYGINESGQIAGTSNVVQFSSNVHAFLYNGVPGAGGEMHDLGTLGGARSEGAAINASGQVAGSSYTSNGYTHAFLYTGVPGAGGSMADLGTLGGTWSGAASVNFNGWVVGSSLVAGTDPAEHAFRYVGSAGAGGSMADLGTLGGKDSRAFDINSAGQVTGESELPGSQHKHAFLYSDSDKPGMGGVMADLGTLGGTESWGVSVDDAGHVVGASFTGTGIHAFLYTGTPGIDGEMIDLDAWLDEVNPSEGSKWTLLGAFSIAGGWVTGQALIWDGSSWRNQAYLLDVRALIPEPASLSLLVTASGMSCRRRRPL